MSGPDPLGLAIQDGLIAWLRAGGTGVGERVYDEVPGGVPKPYAALAGQASTPVDEDCGDKVVTYQTIHVWCDSVGRRECHRIVGEFRAALHEQPVTVPGYVVDDVRVEQDEVEKQPDGLTYRGRLSVRLETQPA